MRNIKEVKKNRYNSNGKRHGYWEFYHDNGQLWMKGNFINGDPDGIWEYYHKNGDLDEIIIYENN